MRLLIALCSAAVLVAGCRPDSAVAPVSMSPNSASTSCLGAPSVSQTTQTFGCNAQISIYDSSGLGLNASIDSAVNIWNAALQGGSNVAVPIFTRGGAGSNLRLKLDKPGVEPWCGETHLELGQIKLISQPDCLTNYTYDFSALLVHEFAHAAGFTGRDVHKFGGPAASHCAHYLPEDHTINRHVCQAEVEWLYATYGMRAEPSTSIWGTPIAVGIDAPGSVTVPYQTSVLIQYQSLYYDAGNASGATPIAPSGVSWTSTAPSIASVNGRLVTGNAASGGTTTLTGMITSLPAGYQLSTYVSLFGVKVVAVVPGPPPPSPPGAGFRVSAITAATIPFTSAGTQTVTAVVENGGNPVDILWWVSYSDNSQYSFFQRSYNSLTLDVPVHAGSYNIQIRARPQNGGTTGTDFIQNFPVCTGGGALLSAPQGDTLGGDVTPDAKAGC